MHGGSLNNRWKQETPPGAFGLAWPMGVGLGPAKVEPIHPGSDHGVPVRAVRRRHLPAAG